MAYFEARSDSVNELADALAADPDIQSLKCINRVNILLPQKGESRRDGSLIDLSEDKVAFYTSIVEKAGICEGGAVRGGLIFDLFKIEAPTYEQRVQLLRVERTGDKLCRADDYLEDSDWCILPINETWDLVYSWSVRW